MLIQSARDSKAGILRLRLQKGPIHDPVVAPGANLAASQIAIAFVEVGMGMVPDQPVVSGLSWSRLVTRPV